MTAHVSRRNFLSNASAVVGAAALSALSPLAYAAPAGKRPNFIILVGEDMSPDIGCYGSELSHTPNLDKLAAQGARFNNCFTHCGVCAPSRSGMITGQHPTAIGTHHMRSTLLKPPPMFTHYLQQAGYHVIWTNKTDFNFEVPKGGFDSKADWRNGDLPPGPFLAFFNIFTTHESQVRGSPQVHAKNTARLTPADRQDPKALPLPPFYPDTPEVRNDVRQYHELCTAVDYTVGDVMAMLEKKGLADNTVVIFTGDHGRGMPRMKRWCYDDGTHIPLIVRWPDGIKPGTVSDELVAMVDLPATILSLAGIGRPADFHGVPYLGDAVHPRQYVFSHRDRMDEAYDRIRSVRDQRYRYVRNFQPEVPYAQYINYNEENPIMRSWRATGRAGKLNPMQRQFFAKVKPPEELYDCQADPHNAENLISSADAATQGRLADLRRALDKWIDDTHDLGAVPERDLIARGLVADRLTTEYTERIKLHPKEPPYLE
jgi:N-sulfoglucosamine sulfohydrolase